jgi:2-hydroxy-6-oxonona-2,4-dienedioate hydrolase
MITYPFEVTGTATRIIEAGAGPAVLLVHGLGTRADRWRTTMDNLAAGGRRVIAFDLPGHGFAQKGADFDYSVPGYADFISKLLDAFNLDRVALIGASLGGQAATFVAAKTPNRIESLTLVGSTGLATLGAEARLQISGLLIDMSREAIRARMQRGLRNLALITDEFVEEDFRINNSPGADASFRALGTYFANKIDDHTILDRLLELDSRIPLLLIWGTEDAAVPLSIAENAVARLKRAQFVKMTGAAHNPYMDKPDEFSRAVLEFFDK